jgi:hypothetical protein
MKGVFIGSNAALVLRPESVMALYRHRPGDHHRCTAGLACARPEPAGDQRWLGRAAAQPHRRWQENAIKCSHHAAERDTTMTATNDLAVRRALEAAGVEFIDEDGGGLGLRLRKAHQHRKRK